MPTPGWIIFVKYTSTESGTFNKITLVSRFRRIVPKIKEKSVSHMNRQKVPLIHRGEQWLKLRAICSHPINPAKLCAKMQRCQIRLLKRAFFWTWTAKIPSIHQRGLSLSGQKVNNQKEGRKSSLAIKGELPRHGKKGNRKSFLKVNIQVQL